MKRIFVESLILTFALIVGLLARVQAEIEWAEPVRIKSYLKLDSAQTVKLSQLIEMKKVSLALYDQLDKISLGSGPELGEQRVYSSQVIAQALRSISDTSKTKFIIPTEVKVENRGHELVTETVEQSLLSEYKDFCQDCQLSIKRLNLPILPAEFKNRPWQIESDGRLPKGHFTRKLLIRSEDGQETIFWLSGQLEIKKLVPVLNRSMQIGQRIQAEDFRWEWRDVTFATDGVPAEKTIEGQKMRLTAKADDILFFQMIDREKAVQRGQVVRVFVGQGEWQVSLEAVTEQDGFVGDTVNLRNRQTNRVISGEVVSRGEVRIR